MAMDTPPRAGTRQCGGKRERKAPAAGVGRREGSSYRSRVGLVEVLERGRWAEVRGGLESKPRESGRDFIALGARRRR
jgi:hypothetical protein